MHRVDLGANLQRFSITVASQPERFENLEAFKVNGPVMVLRRSPPLTAGICCGALTARRFTLHFAPGSMRAA